ncbi:MAG: hypothetical protein KAT91_02215 [Candidatus Aenigmarchaeota archaeon]|nr:hypothetical protein [Candidatus Aenigmarchaeota archaeon]
MSDGVNIRQNMNKSKGGDAKISVVIDAVKNSALKYISEQLTGTTAPVYCLGCGETDFSLPDVDVFYNDINTPKLENTKKRVQLLNPKYFLKCDAIEVEPEENAVAVCNFSLHEFALDKKGHLDEKRLSEYVGYLAENYDRILIGEAGPGFLELFGDAHPYLEPEKLSEMFKEYGFDVVYKSITLSNDKETVLQSIPKISTFGGYMEDTYGMLIANNHLSKAQNTLKNDEIAYILDIKKLK